MRRNWTTCTTRRTSTASWRTDRIDWLRVLPFIGMHVMCLGVIWVGVSWFALAVALALYALRMFAITGFYHRYFSHKAFKTSRAVQFVFALLGATRCSAGRLWWAAHHRHHHRHSDTERRAFAEVTHGLLRSHMGWFLTRRGFATDRADPRPGAYPELRWLDRFDILVPVALAVRCSCSAAGWNARGAGLGTSAAQLLIWGFFVSTVVLFHATVTINSLAHRFGGRRYETRDDSRNNGCWRCSPSARAGTTTTTTFPARRARASSGGKIDLTYYGCAMSWLGLVWDLKPVPAHLKHARGVMRIAVVGVRHRGTGRRVAAVAPARRSRCSKPNDPTRRPHPYARHRTGRRNYAVDTGFIVFNPDHYPHLTRLFGELGVESQPTTMSFAVRNERSGLEYNATNLDRLFCQRRNLVSPRFWGMVRGHPTLLPRGAGPARPGRCRPGPRRLPRDQRLRRGLHRRPSAADGCALWSSPGAAGLEFPAKYLVAVHGQPPDAADQRPQALAGGARRVVALRARLSEGARPCARTRRHSVRRTNTAGRRGVRCTASSRFDQVVLACHSDQALALLREPRAMREREVLGAIRYPGNDTVLHTDARLLPRDRRAWAAWNAHVPDGRTGAVHRQLLHEPAAGDRVARTLHRDPWPHRASTLRRSWRG
jgi:fatty-acid desaturase